MRQIHFELMESLSEDKFWEPLSNMEKRIYPFFKPSLVKKVLLPIRSCVSIEDLISETLEIKIF
jgi:hypothetical protein